MSYFDEPHDCQKNTGICMEHGRVMLHTGLCHDCRNKISLTCQHSFLEEITTAGKYRRCTKCFYSEII